MKWSRSRSTTRSAPTPARCRCSPPRTATPACSARGRSPRCTRTSRSACPNHANTDQTASDGDGVGDACDLDDIDFDGVVNALDDCPDVYDKFQVVGQAGKGVACDAQSDRDGDGFNDRVDKCVRTPDPLQVDTDNDGIGDACDGDCAGARVVTFTGTNPGSCSRTSQIICSTDYQCPTNSG